ncbi:MAG: TRAP transporter small permease subunit [Actinomycetota bacterium]
MSITSRDLVESNGGEAGAVLTRLHPLGWLAAGVLVLAVLFSTVLDTKYLIGNLEAWQWAALVAIVVLSAFHMAMHRLRLGLEKIGTFSKTAAWILAWVVFFVQLFNVVTRYSNPLVDQDILIGQMTSLAWQSFAMLFLLGVNFGVRDGVNPRIDFWWANFSNKAKAWLDFVLHAALLLPFIWLAIRILQPYAATSLGRRRDGEWPEGFRVWETWEQSPDADQLPIGFIKAMILVAFVLFGLQIIAELIKTGFVMINREDLGDVADADAPLRVE